MVVYIDEQFLLNWVVDYLLLLLSGRLLGRGFSRLRLALGAGLGAVYSVLCLLPRLEVLSSWPVKLAAGVGMALVAYGGDRRFFRLLAVFFGLSCGLGGGVLALSLLRGSPVSQRGMLFVPLDFKAVLLWSGLTWWLLSRAFHGMGKHSRRELTELRLRLGTRQVRLTALVDSGNTLTVPWGGGKAVVVEWQELLGLVPELRKEDVTDPVAGVSRLETGNGWCLIPYRAVGTASGLLLGLKVDEITVNGKKRQERYVALSPSPVSDGGGYSALVGVE